MTLPTINDAYLYSGDGGIFGLFKVLDELKSKHIEQEINSKWVFFDFARESGKVETEFHVYRLIEEHTMKGTNHPHNLSSNIVVYPHKRKLYVQFFGVNDKLIKKSGNFTDFHFDGAPKTKPKRVTYADWEIRQKVWEDVFNTKDKTPSDNGFIFKLDTFGILNDISNGIFEKLKK
jgi:hypothetical protein